MLDFLSTGNKAVDTAQSLDLLKTALVSRSPALVRMSYNIQRFMSLCPITNYANLEHIVLAAYWLPNICVVKRIKKGDLGI